MREELLAHITETHLRIGECRLRGEWNTKLTSSKWSMSESTKLKNFRKEHKCMLLVKIVTNAKRLKCNDAAQ